MPTVLLVLRHTIELGLLLLQVLVAILVGHNVRRRTDHFGSGFYAVFFCRILCDIAVFSLTFTYTRLTTYNVVPAKLLGQPPSPVVFSFSIAVFIYSQELFHTSIAANRFVTFQFPLLQSKFNSRRYLWAAVASVMLVTVSLSVPRLFGQLILVETGDGYSVINIDKAFLMTHPET
ncbi:hypothetical protein AAVH_22866 [Aphelenchoides avenae]|nr:hypothetical protein AAVH_22866 [Aphelenchus avenae]